MQATPPPRAPAIVTIDDVEVVLISMLELEESLLEIMPVLPELAVVVIRGGVPDTLPGVAQTPADAPPQPFRYWSLAQDDTEQAVQADAPTSGKAHHDSADSSIFWKRAELQGKSKMAQWETGGKQCSNP